MIKIVCEVIKKIMEDPGFDRALSFILFKKWLDIVPASADEWPISADEWPISADGTECIICTYMRDSDGKPALVH